MMSNILITGGTGSFGQAFVERCIHNKECPYEKIIIYSRDEHKQEQMERRFQDSRLRFFLGDIRDKDRLKLAARECIYMVHAAALKIVPAGEYNPMEFIKTNILGAQNIIDVAVGLPYMQVIALSTDKAVNPINLYGYTKGCMEKLFLASNALLGDNDFSRFSVVRYGNVANSNGSVIPLFKKYKEKGEPLPVTDTRMTRFWIELDQAADFVYNKLQSMEKGKVYIPEMPSFSIMELVDAFRTTYRVTGIRPGEKLHEQIDTDLFSNSESQRFLTCQELREKLLKLNVISEKD